jgi:DNA helicase HerA-like ATPase
MLSRGLYENMKKRHSAVLGMTRSGKTYFVSKVFKQMQEDGVHTIFVDPKSEITDLGRVCKTPMEAYAALLSKTPAIVLHTPAAKEERVAALNSLMEKVFTLSNKPGFKRIRRVIAIDEIQTFVRKGSNDAIEQLYLVGAGKGIVGIGMTQRLQLMSETVWSQAENKVIFRIDDRPEYLKGRNLEHYIEHVPFFMSPEYQYWYYFTAGDGTWKKSKPIGSSEASSPPNTKPKSLKRLRLDR